MRIALVHDYLAQDGGAEAVLRAFQEIWPEAPTYVLFYNKKTTSEDFGRRDIRTTFMQKLPFVKSRFQWFLPLMPHATETFELDSFDVVLSSTSAFAKGVITQPTSLHISYCHTPTRYLWNNAADYVGDLKYNWFVKKGINLLLTKLRLWDSLAASRVDVFLANSRTVAHRILKFYRRESAVVNQPIEADKFSVAKKIDDYFAAGGRLVSYKRFDLIIRAFNRLGLRLKIFGDGPEYQDLRAMAKDNIEFLGRVSDETRAEVLSRAIAFIHPQEEDFGLTAVESMASGRPVIAWARGGALESVIPGLSGEFFDEQIAEDLAAAVMRFRPENYHPQKIREYALKFDVRPFRENIKKFVENEWRRFQAENHAREGAYQSSLTFNI